MKKRSFCLFLDFDFYEKVKAQAKKRSMSMTCYIKQAIIDYIERG